MAANICYVKDDGTFAFTDNSTMIHLYDMLQRIVTFKGEQSFNANNGIDYFAIFNRQSFLKPAIEAIENDYIKYFRDITNEFIANRESVTTNIRVVLQSGEVVNLSAII